VTAGRPVSEKRIIAATVGLAPPTDVMTIDDEQTIVRAKTG